MLETTIALIAAVSGVALKTLWDSYVDKKKALELEVWKIRVTELEKRLSQFYWPVYLRLQRDNVVWQRILDRSSREEDWRKLAYEIEKNVLLANHMEIVKVVETNIHLAALDPEFEDLLMKYLRHVDVFRSIRAVGIVDKDPLNFGEPYPAEFFAALEKRLRRYQREYEAILEAQGIV